MKWGDREGRVSNPKYIIGSEKQALCYMPKVRILMKFTIKRWCSSLLWWPMNCKCKQSPSWLTAGKRWPWDWNPGCPACCSVYLWRLDSCPTAVSWYDCVVVYLYSHQVPIKTKNPNNFVSLDKLIFINKTKQLSSTEQWFRERAVESACLVHILPVFLTRCRPGYISLL